MLIHQPTQIPCVGVRFLVTLASLAILCCACATARDDFARASNTDSVPAYENFLSNHPKSEFEQQAIDRIAKIKHDRVEAEKERWKQTLTTHTIRGYEAFLSSEPENSALKTQAVLFIRNIIRERVLASLNGDLSKVEEPTQFPFTLFHLPDDIVGGLGKTRVISNTSQEGTVIEGKSGQPDRWTDVTMIRKTVTAWMEEASATVVSSSNPEVSAEFYKDPLLDFGVNFHVTIDMKKKSDPKVATKLVGTGIAVLRAGGQTRVFASGNASKSMLSLAAQ